MFFDVLWCDEAMNRSPWNLQQLTDRHSIYLLAVWRLFFFMLVGTLSILTSCCVYCIYLLSTIYSQQQEEISSRFKFRTNFGIVFSNSSENCSLVNFSEWRYWIRFILYLSIHICWHSRLFEFWFNGLNKIIIFIERLSVDN